MLRDRIDEGDPLGDSLATCIQLPRPLETDRGHQTIFTAEER